MDKASSKLPPPPVDTVPVMYQGSNDDFLGSQDPVVLPREEDGIDFEGEFGVITGPLPMGVEAASALDCVRLLVQWNGQRFGEPHGRKMSFHFGQLIAHAARTRRLTAGCVVGSGTVSNAARSAGSACIADASRD